jgi:hypothetical protein
MDQKKRMNKTAVKLASKWFQRHLVHWKMVISSSIRSKKQFAMGHA